MSKPFKHGKSAIRRWAGYVSPERLATFKLMFETVCDELAIPSDAIAERQLLATAIMAAGKTVESEMMLVTTAMEAIADYRQKLTTTVAQLPAGRDTTSDIHTEL